MDRSCTDSADGNGWRTKYYDSLQQLEQREAHWARLERLLRGTISRMALALEGADAQLDGSLRRLRADVRGGADEQRLIALSTAVTDALDRLDHSRRSRERAGPCATMLLLLEQLDLAEAPTSADLRRRLERGGDGRATAELMSEFAALVRDAWDGASPGRRSARGLLARLQRRRAAASPEALSSLHALIERLHLDGDEGAALERRRQGLQGARQADLDRLAAELGTWLDRLLCSRRSASAGSMPSHEALLQLIERLDLPAELDDDVGSLKRRLEAVPEPGDWPQVLEQMADLLRRARASAQQDKREIEQFLIQLSERLKEVDQVFGLLGSQRDDSRSDRRQLGDSVRVQVNELRAGVLNAADLGQLQALVEQRLQAISGRVQAYLEDEEARNLAADARIGELGERMAVLERETSELRARVRVQQEAALFDSLTGIHNRCAYEERVQQERARWKRFGEPVSLAVIDIDHFKEINDTYGHQAGDKVLTTLAQLLVARIRGTDFVARYGGEEFVVILPGADAPAALEVTEELRRAVESCGFHFRGMPVSVTISAGVAAFAGNDVPEQVFARADAALYQAKAGGRNCTVLEARG